MCNLREYSLLTYRPPVGITKAPYTNFPITEILYLAKVYFKSRSYLAGVAEVQLRGHLSNMNVILYMWPLFWVFYKPGGGYKGTEEIGSVTPTLAPVSLLVVVVSFISNRIQQWNNTRKKKTLCRYP